jgi:hypothetical protein
MGDRTGKNPSMHFEHTKGFSTVRSASVRAVPLYAPGRKNAPHTIHFTGNIASMNVFAKFSIDIMLTPIGADQTLDA